MAENAFAKAVRTFAGTDEDDVFRHEEVAGLDGCTHDGSLICVFGRLKSFRRPYFLDFFFVSGFLFGKDKTHPQAVGFDILSNDFTAVLFHNVLRQGKP